ncbi:MAG: hypothetical protein ACRDF5_01480 [bacterium]
MKGRRRKQVVYLAGFGVILFAGLALLNTVLQTPPRSGAVDLAGTQVQVTIRMAPDPPRTGPIPVEVVLTDNRQRSVPVDGVTLRYGAERQRPDLARTSPVAPGVYRTEIKFLNVGPAWLEVIIRRGTSTGRLTFPVDVRPNI